MIKDTSGQDNIIEPVKSGRIKYALLLVVSIVLVFVAYHFSTGNSADQSVKRNRLQLATLQKGELVRDILASGRVIAANAPQVYAPAEGYVDLFVKAGDTVVIDQLIARLESPELETQLKQQSSELDSLKGELARKELDARRQTLQLTKLLDLAEVDLQSAERENRRAQTSIENHLISQIDYEKAIDDLARAQLTFKHAKQEVELAKDTLAFELDSAKSQVMRQRFVVEELERQLTKLEIKATVNGVVGSLFIQPRSLVTQNSSLMTLVDLSAYEAELKIAEGSVNELTIGLPVEMRIGNQTLMGKLAAISPEVNEREVVTRVTFNQADYDNLRQNQQISGRVLLESKKNVLKVRRGSFTQAGGFIAYKVDGNRARKVKVQLGTSSLSEVEIIAGLQENDQIIISNYDNFIDADTILLRD